ncbi:MAG TPA: alternative ribosome rescue aminoacyl-tRNA hydrolase ArfB [Gemmatimonas sp.]|uniref:alternative ribosome rescue aminoacyl-tRNA hydrolase ArfB n=1 Tax=Gemmatimonas sp. TaxID=1962908 RepID=UPI002EDA988F
MSAHSAETSLAVAPGVFIPLDELDIRAISGGGPGGQHVNKSATRIAVQWNVRTTRALRDEQRVRVLEKLASRLDSDGALRIVAGEFRSQQQNRRAALERLQHLISHALIVPRVRRATRPTRGSVEDRLSDKRRRSETKQQRRRDHGE